MLVDKIDLKAASEMVDAGNVPSLEHQLHWISQLRKGLKHYDKEELDEQLNMIFLGEQARVLSSYGHLLASASSEEQREFVSATMSEELGSNMDQYVEMLTIPY